MRSLGVKERFYASENQKPFLSIRHKLRFAFGTIIVLCMAAAMIGAFGIGTVFTSSRTLYNDFVQSQGAVNRLLADFKQNELLTGSLLLNPTKESARQLTEAPFRKIKPN